MFLISLFYIKTKSIALIVCKHTVRQLNGDVLRVIYTYGETESYSGFSIEAVCVKTRIQYPQDGGRVRF